MSIQKLKKHSKIIIIAIVMLTTITIVFGIFILTTDVYPYKCWGDLIGTGGLAVDDMCASNIGG